jgi:hypothetical protein
LLVQEEPLLNLDAVMLCSPDRGWPVSFLNLLHTFLTKTLGCCLNEIYGILKAALSTYCYE